MTYDTRAMVYEYLKQGPATRQEICHHLTDLLEWREDRVSKVTQEALLDLSLADLVRYERQRWRAHDRP